MHKKFQSKILKGNDRLEDLGAYMGDNIKTDPKDLGCEGVEWIKLAQHRTIGGIL
jgi:hypothetical protein